MVERFRSVVRLVIAVGRERPPSQPRPDNRGEFAEVVEELLTPHQAQLKIAPERVAYFIRLLALSGAMPGTSEDMVFGTDELTELIMHGIVERKR